MTPEAEPRRGRDRLRAVGWPPVVYVLCAVWFCSHLLSDPAQRVVAANPHDVTLIGWLLSAQPTALLHGHNPLLLHSMNAPQGIATMWNTGLLLPSLLLAPITSWLGGTFSFNLLLVVGLAGSAWTAYLVAARYVRHRHAAFVAGLMFGFGPAMTHQALGHLQLVFAPLVPLLLEAVVVAVTGPFSWRRSVRLGLLAAAQVLTGEELFACTAVAAVLIVVVLALCRPRTAVGRARGAIGGLATAGAVFVAVAGGPLAYQLWGPLRVYGSAFPFESFKSDLAAFTKPDQLLLLHSAASAQAPHFSGGLPEQNAYLGWPLLIVALLALALLWRRLPARVAGVVAVVLAVFSLGGHLLVNGRQTTVPLPWSLFDRWPLLSALLPNRFGLLVAGLVGLLLALLLDRLSDLAVPAVGRTALVRASAWLGCCLVVLPLLPLVPVRIAAVTRPAAPSLIASGDSHRVLPGGSTVLMLPFPTGVNPQAMDWQEQDGLRWSMPGGYFVGPACEPEHCRGRSSFGGLRRGTGILLSRIGRGQATPAQITDAQVAGAAADLRYWRIDRVLVGPAPRQQQLVAAVTRLLGHAGTRVDDSVVWTVGQGRFVRP